jgi:transposase
MQVSYSEQMNINSGIAPILASVTQPQDFAPRYEHVGFVPVALGVLRQMNVAELIDKQLEPKHKGPQHAKARADGEPAPLAGPTPGQCVEAMVVSILDAGRVTLYAMEDWIRQLPVQQYWGPQVAAEHFSDDRLASTLDTLWDMGLESTFGQVMSHSLTRFGLTVERLHSDGSTVTLQGAYELPPGEPGPVPLRGFSKDNDRNCKQLVIGATVQQDGIPLAFGLYDGNTTDQPIYRAHMEAIATAMRSSATTTFIADCKLCDQYCLGALYKQNLDVITLIPRTHSSHQKSVDAALKVPWMQWPVVAQRPCRSSDEPTEFRCMCVPVDMQLAVPGKPGQVNEKGEPTYETKIVSWTAVVVHSSQLARVHTAELNAKWHKTLTTMQQAAKALHKERFETQDLAEQAVARWLKTTKTKGWRTAAGLQQESVPVRRGRGRPKAAEVPPPKQVWRVELSFEPDEQLRLSAMQTAGVFVLVSSRPLSDSFTASDVLDQYREQHQVETSFRWLKQPGAVAPMFLHKPSRLAALGLVFALALAVYRIIQHRVRTALANRGQTIPGNNRQPTNKPTTAVVAKLFHNVHRIILSTPQGERVWLHGLTPAHELVLAILELPIDLGLSETPGSPTRPSTFRGSAQVVNDR